MTPRDLKAWRKRRGLSPSEAASKLGISVSDINNYEGGEKPVEGELLLIWKSVERACASFDQKEAIKTKIREQIVDGPPGHITPKILQEILLSIVDAT